MPTRFEVGGFLSKLRRATAASVALLCLSGIARATTPQTTIQPSLGITFNVQTSGLPQDLALVQMFAGGFAPNGFSRASGQTLNVAGNSDLFTALGTTYGGDGVTTFGLPNLNGSTVIGTGQGTGLTNRTLGSLVGANSVTLTPANAPITLGGGGQAFSNMQSSLPLNFYISTGGIYPSAGGQPQPFLGQILISAGNSVPSGCVPLDGSLLLTTDQPSLFSIIGTEYGGDGTNTFAVPDLRGRTPIGVGTGPGLSTRVVGDVTGTESTTLSKSNYPSPTGSSAPYSNMQPSLAMHYIIALQGIYPSPTSVTDNPSPFLGEIVLFAGNFAPTGWAFCDGQTEQINQNQALFSLLSASFGGNGTTTFALPNLDSRIAVGQDGGVNWPLGSKQGVENLVASASELPVPEPASIALLAAGFSLLPRRRARA